MIDNKLIELRQKAEKVLQQKSTEKAADYINDVEKLVEELNIFQIELEMQNQELHETNIKLTTEQKRYKDLYMNAPVAYLTLNHTGNILELNKAAAKLLQLPIQKFKYTSIFPYIAEQSKIEFVKSFKEFFNSTEIEYGEIIFLKPNKEFIFTQLSAICYFDNELNETLVRCAVTDITQTKRFQKELELQKNLEKSQKELLATNEILNRTNNELLIAKEKAEQSEQHNQMLFEILPIGLALTKMNGDLIYVNKAYTDIIGYTTDETLKLSYWDITPEKYAPQEQIQIESLNSTGFYGPYEKEYKHKSGNLIPVRLIGRIIKIRNENLIWSSIENITERIITEKLIKTEREQFLSLLNDIPEPIYVSDIDTYEIIFANTAIKQNYGENIVGKKCHSALYNLDSQCDFCQNHLLLNNTEKIIRWEKSNYNIQKYFLNIEKLINWHDGRTVKFQIAFDITELKKAQQKIEQLNNRIENSMLAGNLAWWELELPSGKVRFNQNKAIMLGYKPEDFEHYNDFMKLVHPDDYEMAMHAMIEHLNGNKEIYECEFRIKTIHNEYLWFHDIGKTANKTGDNVLITGIASNISQRKHAEFLIKENEERLKLAVNAAKAGVWDWFYNTGELKFNSYFCEMLGFTENEIENNLQAFVKLVHPIDVEAVKTEFGKMFSKEIDVFYAEYRMKTKDNNWK